MNLRGTVGTWEDLWGKLGKISGTWGKIKGALKCACDFTLLEKRISTEEDDLRKEDLVSFSV